MTNLPRSVPPDVEQDDTGSDAGARLAALEAFLIGREFEVVPHDAGLTVIGPPVEGGLRFTTMVTCCPRPDDDNRLWFVTDEGEWLAEADRVIDAAMAVTTLLSPTS